MAYVGSTNNTLTAATGAQDFCYTLKAALVAAGWTVQGSSDGTTWNNTASGDNVSTYAKWTATGSWVRMREPSGAGGREYVFMRGTGTGVVIKYSRSVGFGTGGGATTLPTTGASGDGVVWIGTSVGFSATGTGTNTYDLATTTTAQQVSFAGTTGYVSAVASTTPVNGVYGFWLIMYTSGSGALTQLVYSEGIDPNCCSPLDYDPSYRQFAGNNWWANDTATINQCHYWQGYPSPWASPTTATYRLNAPGYSYWATVNSAMTSNVGVWPSSSVQSLNPYNQKYASLPMLISTVNTVGVTPKGFSSGVRLTYGTLNPLDTLDLTTADPRIVFFTGGSIGGLTGGSMPWVTNVLPLV